MSLSHTMRCFLGPLVHAFQVRPETDAMASLLGHFDMDSRRGDESTLKAPTNGQRSDGPVDFSTLRA